MAFGPAAAVNPLDAERLEIVEGERLVIAGESARLSLPATINEQVLPGTIWIPQSQRDAPVGDLLRGQTAVRVDVTVDRSTNKQTVGQPAQAEPQLETGD